MRSLIAIPARLESSRLPRKLLLAETGRPLICHTVDTALQAMERSGGRIAQVLVATDSEEILEAVTQHVGGGAGCVRAVMTRADHASGSDRIAEAVQDAVSEIDTIINLQGDEPTLEPETVMLLLDRLEEDAPRQRPADIATLVYPIHDEEAFVNPNLVKCVFAEDGTALYFSRSPIPFDRDRERNEDAPIAYGHVGLYAYRRASLERFVRLGPGALEQRERLEQLRALESGMRIVVGTLSTPPRKGIDTREDYEAFVRSQASISSGTKPI